MPARHCIAVDCTSDSRKNSDIVFYQLPKVDSIQKKWLKLVRREGLKINPTSDLRSLAVCSKHFVDGGPTFENPLPTLFSYNNYKQSTPRKTKNSYQGRQILKKGQQNEESQSEPVHKKIRLVKCDEDKSQVCYPYVSGEVDIPDSTAVTYPDCKPNDESGTLILYFCYMLTIHVMQIIYFKFIICFSIKR